MIVITGTTTTAAEWDAEVAELNKRAAIADMKTEADVLKADGRLFKGPADTRRLIHRLHQIRKGAL